MRKKRLKRAVRKLACERLESRCVLSALVGGGDEFHPVIVAGDPNGSPADSPSNRVDANSDASPFGGVGSLQISASSGLYICTGTPIDATHVLTAGHCVDIDNNGIPDVTGIVFNLNYGGNLTSQIAAASWRAHPDFTGFNRPSINDDLAVITLASPLPSGVPTYALPSTDMVAGVTQLHLVGYGRSGDGVIGYSTGASFTTKRDGENMVDAFYRQDDARRSKANEVFRFDFDGTTGNGSMGGPTLGNDRETTLGGGDSGGPSFALRAGTDPALASSYVLVGVNTFTQGFSAPLFGSLGGGINVFPYKNWILNGTTDSGSGGGGGKGKGNGGQLSSILFAMQTDSGVAPMVELHAVGGDMVNIASSTASSATASSATVVVAQTDCHRFEWLANRSIPRATAGKRTLEDTAMTANGIDDAEAADDFVPAIDAVLSRWSG